MQTDYRRIVLCAEDDPDDKELFCQTAEEIDPTIKVIHSENGKTLLEKLHDLTSKGTFPCLITLDMNMPIMDGKEALIEIRKNPEWETIPIVIYTTSTRHKYADLEDVYKVTIVTKPSQPGHIKQKITELLSYCKAA